MLETYNKIQNRVLQDLLLSSSTSFKKLSAKNITKDFLLECIKINANIVITHFPYNSIELTQDISEALVNKNKYLIEDIPKEHITYEMAKRVVKEKGNLLEYIPSGLVDKDLAILAVQEDGYNLRLVPNELKDNELCLIAIKNDKSAIDFTPFSIKSEKGFISLYEKLRNQG